MLDMTKGQGFSCNHDLQSSNISKMADPLDPFSGLQMPSLASFLSSSSTTSDMMNPTAASTDIRALNANTQIQTGTLRAETFSIEAGVNLTIVSGNGNIDYGSGSRDLLNLSDMSYGDVAMGLANLKGGVVYNPGNGSRAFDVINFSDGRQVLFEAIDAIQFSDGIVNLSVVPNDPLFGQEWNLHMMGVHNAWRFTKGSDSVLIGVEDQGLSVDGSGNTHPDLSRTTWIPGEQLIDDGTSPTPHHGTQVQGIITAKTNNGEGMSGINWNSRTFNIDVLGGEAGDMNYASAAQTIIDDARQNGQRLVINLSLTSPLNEMEQVVHDNPDVLFVIAAGNNGQSEIAYPAILAKSYDNVMAIGASWGLTGKGDGLDKVPGSRIHYDGGENPWGSQYGDGLTVMGPSEVTAPTINELNEFTYSDRFNGTSAAAPNVTGVASLVLSANSNLSAAQVRQILSETAVDVGAPGFDQETGHGFINADAAVRRAIAIGQGYA